MPSSTVGVVCHGHAVEVHRRYAHSGKLTGLFLHGMRVGDVQDGGGDVYLALEECLSASLHPAR